MYQRPHIQVLIDRIEREPRRFIQVITGPRQDGKTTMVTQFVEHTSLLSHVASGDAVFENPQTWIREQWQAARVKLLQQADREECVLVIDEIQKIPNWSEQVKREWDADTRNHVPLKVILLGSSRLLLQQGLTESLMGRFESTYLAHWSYQEMEQAFGWDPDTYAWFGGYPGAATLIQDEKRWRAYVLDSLIETSVSKDILMLTRVDKPALLKRLFEFGSRYSGQMLSYTKVVGQLQDAGNTTTLAHYVTLLSTAGLLTGLEKYAQGVIRQRASSPKFQVHNNAFLSVYQPLGFSQVRSDPKVWGRFVESAVGAHLLNHAIAVGGELHYWRQGGSEVDFVYQQKGKVLAIEVKSGQKGNTPGMQEFLHQYPDATALLVSPDTVSWQTFLTLDPDSLF